MPGDGDKDAPKAAPPERSAKADALREKIGAALLGFFLTGVVGTMVATWFQARGWAWQNRVMQVEKDTSSVLDSLRSASDLLDKRWSASLQMLQAMQNPADGDGSKAAKATFLSVNNDWELHYANVDAAVEFNVDRPFGVEAKRTPDALWTFQCDAYPFADAAGGAIEPDAAHALLTVINHCQGLVKADIDEIGKDANDPVARQRLIDRSHFRLSNIYYINDALRCVILERAVAMRRSLDVQLGWASFFQDGSRTYDIPAKERDCLVQYREWSSKNRPKQQ
jgi:hypothetical protein